MIVVTAHTLWLVSLQTTGCLHLEIGSAFVLFAMVSERLARELSMQLFPSLWF